MQRRNSVVIVPDGSQPVKGHHGITRTMGHKPNLARPKAAGLKPEPFSTHSTSSAHLRLDTSEMVSTSGDCTDLKPPEDPCGPACARPQVLLHFAAWFCAVACAIVSSHVRQCSAMYACSAARRQGAFANIFGPGLELGGYSRHLGCNHQPDIGTLILAQAHELVMLVMLVMLDACDACDAYDACDACDGG